MKPLLPLALGALLISGCTFFGDRSGYEQPSYEVIGQVGEAVEIRAYAPRLAAEATVQSDDVGDGRDDAFRLLFDYISGGNRSETSIAMTTPVESAAASQKIEMTVPVETARSDGNRVYMRFFLPARYNRETAPEPLDPRVRIVAVPAQTKAVLRFSGLGREKTVAEKKADLLKALDGAPWRATAEPVAYFYDPPWTPPFFRRNEVAVTAAK